MSDLAEEELDQIQEKLTLIKGGLDRAYQGFTRRPGPEKVRIAAAGVTEFLVSGAVFGLLLRGAGSLLGCAASQVKKHSAKRAESSDD